MPRSTISRRNLLRTTALAAAAAVSAPYVRHSYAAGKLALGVWDHWVPGANNTLTKLCNEWGEKNKVEVSIDYITSQGDKDLLTASAEAQARAGHDIMSHRAWQIQVHRNVLEPVDDVIKALVAKAGPISPVSEYLAKHEGKWFGIPTTVGSQVKPCCSRMDLYKQHCGIDLTAIFPANDNRDPKLVDTWTWDLYLKSAEQLFKAGFPIGLPMGQTSDAIDSTGAMFRAFGSVMIDEKDNLKVDSNETRAALEYFKKLMPFNPPEVYAWDDAGNNRWLISGKGAGIQNPPSAWAVAKRDNPQVAAQCWTHDMPRGPAGRFVGQLPFFYGIWSFSQNKAAAKDLLQFLSEKEQSRQLVAASSGYDLPSFKSYYDFDTWQKVEPPSGTVYNYPPRGDEQPTITGYPARPDIATQIYNQSLHTIMVAKVCQGNEPIDRVVKWAQNELEGLLRT
ncbi:MAG: extracellular solute-binding protein [Alphaproteobacteria bacterium]|nr:MAG: extracellular solute-binding protein [Alphaproteobacteria bacterium]